MHSRILKHVTSLPVVMSDASASAGAATPEGTALVAGRAMDRRHQHDVMKTETLIWERESLQVKAKRELEAVLKTQQVCPLPAPCCPPPPLLGAPNTVLSRAARRRTSSGPGRAGGRCRSTST